MSSGPWDCVAVALAKKVMPFLHQRHTMEVVATAIAISLPSICPLALPGVSYMDFSHAAGLGTGHQLPYSASMLIEFRSSTEIHNPTFVLVI